jgi:hypothetical protein
MMVFLRMIGWFGEEEREPDMCALHEHAKFPQRAETSWPRARFNPAQLLELGGSQFAEIKNVL